MVCFSSQKFNTFKNNVALWTPQFCKLPYATGSVKRELSGKIMSLYNSGKIPSCKIVCSLCVRIFLSHHMPLYFLETSVLNNEGNKPFASIFERGYVEIWRTDADQVIHFSSQVSTLLFAIRTYLSLLSTFRRVSNELCFVMSSVLPSSVSDSKQTDFLPTQCRRTTPEFVKLFWVWFSLVHYKNHLIAWKNQSIELINHVGPNINYTIAVTQDKQLHILLIYISPYLAAACFGWSPSLGNSTRQLRTRSDKLVLTMLCVWMYRCTFYKHQNWQYIMYDKWQLIYWLSFVKKNEIFVVNCSTVLQFYSTGWSVYHSSFLIYYIYLKS
jgi:hypothetical protein